MKNLFIIVLLFSTNLYTIQYYKKDNKVSLYDMMVNPTAKDIKMFKKLMRRQNREQYDHLPIIERVMKKIFRTTHLK